MQKVIRYQCDDCGRLFYTEKECITHEEQHKKIEKANKMLRNGCTLKKAVPGLCWFRGCGSWSGYYGNEVSITSDNLKKPKFGEPIYEDPRYHI